ncbi:hypothetical protein M9H77_21120 [Catharanthus roseus]|uniref:Uncharacterized protein n=1 Tax=Catharanthus roseus TaxID=4058 RepID=A0ACC0ALE2_CATRO|nr:hypothetical protein M9H77_21120 [Catharanthus roseus]
MGGNLLGLLFLFCSSLLSQLCISSPYSLPLGAHPLDEKFYESEVINCKDGSKSFSRERINDNFCDCPDGSDEPGTSACPSGKFYCRNVGSTPRFLYSSLVNDHICDCCDGSDEYDGIVNCPNTCIVGANFIYNSISYDSTIRQQNPSGFGRNKLGLNAKESTEKLRGFKVLLILQGVLVTTIVAYCVYCRRGRPRRRHSR